ncbi:hypothetical protein BBD39_05325 [Arsenophonus endosymbiont of Bemisia tabaci Asia II 3]|nr:hypothetical protein BBD39_05325 [Arsenophonus endosymbiont of Bemisia tabaci Asia II 3]
MSVSKVNHNPISAKKQKYLSIILLSEWNGFNIKLILANKILTLFSVGIIILVNFNYLLLKSQVERC